MKILISGMEKTSIQSLYKMIIKIDAFDVVRFNDVEGINEDSYDKLSQQLPDLANRLSKIKDIAGEETAIYSILLFASFQKVKADIQITPHRFTTEDIARLPVTSLKFTIDTEYTQKTNLATVYLIKALLQQGVIHYTNPNQTFTPTHQYEGDGGNGDGGKRDGATPHSVDNLCTILIDSTTQIGSNIPHTEEHIDPEMLLLQANIDDMNAEWFPYVIETLLKEGANDAYTQPIYMKKGRPAVMLNVLCSGYKVDHLESIIFQETTTLGIRRLPAEVHRLARKIEEVETPWGKVHVKKAWHKGELTQLSPEFEDCKRIATEHNLPLKKIYQWIMGMEK